MSDALAAFRWRDALDILLVAIVIYRVFVMFRGTRAVQMMIGISALATASLLARQLELYSTEWLLDNLWSFWVIALVVLFQPELRRALASLGQGRVGQALLRAAGEEGAQVLDEIGSAVESLSARRIGALLVVERATGLRQYAELGVPLDARVSADLLVSVFLPYSPLHDGAVFIQGTRIAAAGCFLPLSRNLQVGRALGTRHRAALGITEETDAIAIVVSEESGRISLAVEGQMESPVEAGSLRQRFLTLAGGTPVPAGRPSFWLALRRLLPLPGKHA
ncbi:MAG: TIGR00159 family protein [Candidatus Rokubacteria bacterium 13_2_20CM_69_15_1]|nr:MAG: TIGR00159 family protein [Candidatus Rokubacteria bacterium 13_2_20CM_69_15_1]